MSTACRHYFIHSFLKQFKEMENRDQLLELDDVLKSYEGTLSWKTSGSIADRTRHCLSQYRSIADNAIFSTKAFAEDVKTQFKALEIITEGLTSDGLNHGQKRTIANHIITMLRSMVDRMSQQEYNYSTHAFDRYNYLRSDSPERRLMEALRDLKDKNKRDETFIKMIKEKYPEVLESLNNDEIPF